MNRPDASPLPLASSLIALLLAACSSPPPPAEPPPPPAETAPATTAAAATEAPAEQDKKADDAPAAPTAAASAMGAFEKMDGDVRVLTWTPGAGATAKPLTAKRAWVPAANMFDGDHPGDSFKAVRWKLVDIVKADDKQVVYVEGNQKYAVPAILAVAAPPASSVKKGGFVRCSFAGSYAFGRFEGASAKGASCSLRFMGKTKKEPIPADGAWAAPSTIAPGAVVSMKHPEREERLLADVYFVEGEDVWVDTREMQVSGATKDGPLVKVKKADLLVVDLPAAKPLAKGDAVLAKGNFGAFTPAVVTEVVDGGLAYKAKGEGMGDKELEIDDIGRAPKTK